MKDVKAMIPIITLVLLICVLAGTFAWFSSYTATEMGGIVNVRSSMEVLLDLSSIGTLTDYNGQKGYDNLGNIKSPPDSPYIFDFDVTYRVVGDTDMAVSFGFGYIAVKLNEQKALPFTDAVSIVFGDTTFVDNEENRKAYLGVKSSYEYDPDEVGGADYFDVSGNHLAAGTTIYTYQPMYQAANADKKGLLITNGVDSEDKPDGSGDVTEIIIKSEYVAEYFHLQYAMWDSTDTFPATPTWVRFDTPKQFAYSATTKDVYETAAQCKQHKTKIKVGLYHDFGITESGHTTQFGEFVFSDDSFRGCTFVFSFRIMGEEVSA